MSPTSMPSNILASEDLPAHMIDRSSLSLRLPSDVTSKKSQECLFAFTVSSGCSRFLPGELESRHLTEARGHRVNCSMSSVLQKPVAT